LFGHIYFLSNKPVTSSHMYLNLQLGLNNGNPNKY